MQRARRTAELAGFPDPQVTELLREFNYGEYEGLTSAEIQASRPGWEIYHDGCPGGESPAQVYARAQQFIDLANSAAAGGGDVLVFAHGHILRAVGVAWLALDITVGSSRCGTRRDSAPANSPGPAANAGQPCEHEVRRRLDLRAITVSLARVDEQHLARANLGPFLSVVEMQRTDGHDQRHRDGVAVLGHVLACLEAQPDHAHRAAVTDLLEADGATWRARAMH